MVNNPVAVAFNVSFRVAPFNTTTRSKVVARLYSPDHAPRKLLAFQHPTRPDFISVTVPGMGVYSIVVFAWSEAELQARADGSVTRKWLERLLVANSSVGSSLYLSKSEQQQQQQQGRSAAMYTADRLL